MFKPFLVSKAAHSAVITIVTRLLRLVFQKNTFERALWLACGSNAVSCPYFWGQFSSSGGSVSYFAAQVPVAEFTFNEGSGTTVHNVFGAQDARLSTGIRWEHGIVGWAISANSDTWDYAALPAIDLRHAQAATIALWIKQNGQRLTGETVLFATANDRKSRLRFRAAAG